MMGEISHNKRVGNAATISVRGWLAARKGGYDTQPLAATTTTRRKAPTTTTTKTINNKNKYEKDKFKRCNECTN